MTKYLISFPGSAMDIPHEDMDRLHAQAERWCERSAG
jgi:hypothetical protein